MMEEIVIGLENLTEDRVYVVKQKYIVVGDIKYEIGQPWRRAYDNTMVGRDMVKKEIEEKYTKVIFTMWGDKPTVAEKSIK